MKNFNLSWIVATLGKSKELEKIFKTALNLTKKYNVKLELIFSLPPGENLNKKNIYKYKNQNFKFLILNCPQKGQVFQRDFALKYASYETILFSDDDIQISSKNVFKLLEIKMSLPFNSVIGPKLIPYKKNLKPIYPDTLLLEMGFPINLIKKFLNIKSLGSGESTDLGIGSSFYNINKNIFPVGWLPGAFTIHTKENIFLSDIYSWKGKAYAEDYFQAISLRRQNINYFFIKDITYKCDLTFSNTINLFKKIKDFYLTFIRIYQVQHRLYRKSINLKLIIYFILIIIYKIKIIINFKSLKN